MTEDTMTTESKPLPHEALKPLAKQWFEALRDEICASYEELEADLPSHTAEAKLPPSHFERQAWQRVDAETTQATGASQDTGGGVMAVMRNGRVFEKVGVNCSTVYGKFSEKFRQEIPGAAKNDGQFWASGVSLVAHPRNPKVPAAHFNTRFIVTDHGWFGGGGDLTPVFPQEADTHDFHQAFQKACDSHDASYYPKFKAWCDDYFYLPHRAEARGVGGIFFDYIGADDTHSLLAQFEFVKAVGRSFRDIYPQLVRRHFCESYSAEDRRAQLVKRGRYAEFNLLYDRGTRFGLMTGGNVEAILMSLPPEAIWP